VSLLPQELLNILACPAPECRAPLRAEAQHLLCTGCGRRYPVTDRWPTLIPEEAEAPAGSGTSQDS
jgi:uncharacterized protein YbaR (Trm112 family)